METSTRPQRTDVANGLLRRWENDPVQFALDVFGVKCWSRQRELLLACAAFDRVSVASGHKVSKSFSCAILAIWWAVTRPRARVILFAPTFRQVNEIIWREIRELYHRRARFPLGGQCFTKPEEGVRWRDDRQIFGFSTEGKEGFAGFSGNVLYLLDEASGIPDDLHEVVSTTTSGKVVMISNPTRTEGAFFRSHHEGSHVWKCLTISSEEAARENPTITLSTGERRPRIRGLANAQWIADRKLEYGEASYYYDVRIRGLFSAISDSTMIPLNLVQEAQARWSSAGVIDRATGAVRPAVGRLDIGVDVARFGTDDTSIVARRDDWTGIPIVEHGIDNVVVAGRVREVLKILRRPNERPIIRVDTSGLGAGVADILRAQSEDLDIDVIDVQAQESSTDRHFAKRRDQVWGRLLTWLANGGAIAPDDRMRADLTAPQRQFDEKGKIKVESKRDLHKRLKRSTDRADALGLAVFDEANAIEWDPIVARLSSRGG